jgi:Domain of unknown function (DUF4168)
MFKRINETQQRHVALPAPSSLIACDSSTHLRAKSAGVPVSARQQLTRDRTHARARKKEALPLRRFLPVPIRLLESCHLGMSVRHATIAIAEETINALAKAVTDQGLSVDEYTSILEVAQANPEVREKIRKRIRPSAK